MKTKFQAYKNIILLVASALTLVAVTFAWFTTSYNNFVPSLNNRVEGGLLDVAFYKLDGTDYKSLDGEIELDGCVAGDFQQYKMILDTKTADKMKISLSVDDLPTSMPVDLQSSVRIKYTLKKTVKTTEDGVDTYTDGATISESTGYVPISNIISDGVVFSNISLADYQATENDTFVIYYEIGLATDSPSTIEGMSSQLGSINISAQLV